MGERPKLLRSVGRDPLGADPWVLKESLAWFYPHPPLRRAQEWIHFWPRASGKGLTEMFRANHTPSTGRKHQKNRLCRRTQRGAPGGAGLGMTPILSFPPPPPPPSPTALGSCCSGGYDRAVARAKYLLGVMVPRISLLRAWAQQGLEDKVGRCGAWGRRATGTDSLAE